MNPVRNQKISNGVKIYTKVGDRGYTTLYGGKKISKTQPLIGLLAGIDELNSILGVAKAFSRENTLNEWLEMAQNDLFIIQAELGGFHVKPLKGYKIEKLEKIIDKLSVKIDLRGFVVPGGSKVGALLYFSRAICRRAEIQAVRHYSRHKFNPKILQYLNRLSDFLYILARWENRKTKEKSPTYK